MVQQERLTGTAYFKLWGQNMVKRYLKLRSNGCIESEDTEKLFPSKRKHFRMYFGLVF